MVVVVVPGSVAVLLLIEPVPGLVLVAACALAIGLLGRWCGRLLLLLLLLLLFLLLLLLLLAVENSLQHFLDEGGHLLSSLLLLLLLLLRLLLLLLLLLRREDGLQHLPQVWVDRLVAVAAAVVGVGVGHVGVDVFAPGKTLAHYDVVVTRSSLDQRLWLTSVDAPGFIGTLRLPVIADEILG